MDLLWDLTLPQRREKSYVRGTYRTDTVFTFLRYKNVMINFAKKEGAKTRTADSYGEMLQDAGLITEKQLEACQQAVCAEYFYKDCHMEQSPEDIYAFVQQKRLECYGLPALKKARALLRSRGCAFDPTGGIDQRKEKEALLQRSRKVLFLLCDATLFSVMEKDVQTARNLGKEVCICYSPTGAGDLPDKEELAGWLGEEMTYVAATEKDIATDPEGAALLFYGEEGLLHCRDLTVDAVVTAVPTGYHAQALCNLLGSPCACVVYIPKGTDITPYVPIVSPTRLSYHHLARLCRDHGEEIYSLSCEALYEKYPQYFVNIYDNSGKHLPLAVAACHCEAAEQPWQSQELFAQFDQNREKAVAEFLNSFSNIRYQTAFFEEEKLLVHTVRVTKAKDAAVISCPKGVTPREQLADTEGTALVSNFLFFLTEKLGVLYNDLRKDRPLEQADAAAGHLDYMLAYQNGARKKTNRTNGHSEEQRDEESPSDTMEILRCAQDDTLNLATLRKETFPLFSKTCIAGTEDGRFLFFSFSLGGGEVTVNGIGLRWEKEAVNSQDPGDICVYTPMYTAGEKDADRETYRLPVGQGRVNMVILQDRVTCIRKGDVILPSVGVVISLTEAAAEALLCDRKHLGDGYYDVSDIDLTVRLDNPEALDPEVWSQVQWAYGGGMGLIREGTALSDGDMEDWFAREGWMSPLSRQTQESALHKLAKHPRTAIGTAENGDLLVLVFSGRSSRSTGADYKEMVRIARQLYPDVRNLMNVDGGGSAVLGMVHNGAFMELSCPATSQGSCVGMVRPIHTIFYIPAEREEKI